MMVGVVMSFLISSSGPGEAGGIGLTVTGEAPVPAGGAGSPELQPAIKRSKIAAPVSLGQVFVRNFGVMNRLLEKGESRITETHRVQSSMGKSRSNFARRARLLFF